MILLTARRSTPPRGRQIRQFLKVSALALLLGLPTGHARDLPQVRTEVQDLLRGVSMYSVLISDEPVRSLIVLDGEFSEVDRIAVGLSAMTYYGGNEIEEYILWLRHEGRRWLNTDIGVPVNVEADNRVLSLDLLRSPQPFIGEGGRFFEKFEFRVTLEDLEAVTSSQNVVVSFRSASGEVEKQLGESEIDSIRQFLASLSDPG